MLSRPKKSFSTAAAAPLKLEWPEMYVGNGGVTISGVQAGSAVVSGLPSVSAARMPVTGRQKSVAYLASQAMIAASAIATLSIANSRAFSRERVALLLGDDLAPSRSDARAAWPCRRRWPRTGRCRSGRRSAWCSLSRAERLDLVEGRRVLPRWSGPECRRARTASRWSSQTA